MESIKISVDFNKIVGKMKPMHSGNIGPKVGGRTLPLDFTEEFRYMGVPYTRLHDVEYPYGHNQFVDIHCIFPDFDADENLPESYNFKPTDDYIKGIIDAGGKVFYRLGESIDHFDKPLYIHKPKSALKWAKICEHIIMHYNEGWADGFNYGIEYWEIWNEPDNKRMWRDTHEDFFELYRVSANHLKSKFGNSIKVGGYASSGFYVLNRKDASEWFKTLVPYMHEFFEYITSEKTKAPIDFFSWHCYAENPEEVSLHAGYARDLLKKYNLTECESILDEFNMFYTFSEYAPLKAGAFTDVAASLILAQKSDMDMMMYYLFSPNSVYNSAYSLTGIRKNQKVRLAGIEAFADFNSLYALGNEAFSDGDVEGRVNVLAAVGDTCGAIMIATRDFEGEIALDVFGEYSRFDIKRTNDANEERSPTVSCQLDLPVENRQMRLLVKKNELLLLTFK